MNKTISDFICFVLAEKRIKNGEGADFLISARKETSDPEMRKLIQEIHHQASEFSYLQSLSQLTHSDKAEIRKKQVVIESWLSEQLKRLSAPAGP